MTKKDKRTPTTAPPNPTGAGRGSKDRGPARPGAAGTVLTKRQLSRKEQEARQKRIVSILAIVTAAAVLLVLAFGFYQEYVAKPSAPVATVNGKVISTRDYQQMVKYRRFSNNSMIAQMQDQLSRLDATSEDQQWLVSYYQQYIQQLQSNELTLPTEVRDDMIDDELIRQEAAKRNITVTADELQEEIETQFGYARNTPTPAPTATPITTTVEIDATPTPTQVPMTLEEFQTSYSEYAVALRKNADVSESFFRRIFESSLYRSKLQDALAGEVPLTAEQIHARHILVETEEEAKKVVERLQAGEDFAALAKELSTDTGSAESGGDLGWFPRGQMVTEFEDAAFALEPGQTSAPVQTSYGYHIINLIERDANRALDETMLEQKKSTALDDWLTVQRASEAVKSYWSSDMVPEAK
jgi:parvulin-like peptidyl-prolyl isomerase